MAHAVLDERPSLKAAQQATLTEQADAASGTALVKLIVAGWGSMAYYPEDVLRRDAAVAWPKGTHMYWDHPDAEQEQLQPERTLTALAGYLTEAASWRDDGPLGPGVYAQAFVRSDFAGAVAELQEVMGTSVRALFDVEPGEREGRSGQVATAALPWQFNTVDFVTYAGAGGQVQALFESATPGSAANPAKPAESAALTGLLDAFRAQLSEGGTVDTAEAVAAVLAEARTAGQYIEARVHMALCDVANLMFAESTITPDERAAIVNAATAAGDAFRATLLDNAPDLFGRPPWVEPSSTVVADEGSKGAQPVSDDDKDTGATERRQAKLIERQTKVEAGQLAERLLAREGDTAPGRDLDARARAMVLDRCVSESLPVDEDGFLDEEKFEARVGRVGDEFRALLGTESKGDDGKGDEGEAAKGGDAPGATTESADDGDAPAWLSLVGTGRPVGLGESQQGEPDGLDDAGLASALGEGFMLNEAAAERAAQG